LLLATVFVRLDTTGPACLATPADAARNPEHNTTIGVKDPPNHVAGIGGRFRMGRWGPFRRENFPEFC
jgi:hypothetical protein